MPAPTALWTQITRHLSLSCGEDQVFVRADAISGGDIAKAYRLECRSGSYFVKLQARQYLPMFETESISLELMANYISALKNSCRGACPKAICVGATDNCAFLIMEYVEFGGERREAELGHFLASLHTLNCAKIDSSKGGIYGWQQDNFIGLTPQSNAWTCDWPSFFWQQRIEAQLKLASGKAGGQKLNAFYDRLNEQILARLDHSPAPSLLHGDLWSGNKSYARDGTPYIFDPAAYYGDAETDLALSEMFGGFSEDFYRAYYKLRPKQVGYEQRRDIYQLYHMLNHFNLFGREYLNACLGLIDSICRAKI